MGRARLKPALSSYRNAALYKSSRDSVVKPNKCRVFKSVFESLSRIDNALILLSTFFAGALATNG